MTESEQYEHAIEVTERSEELSNLMEKSPNFENWLILKYNTDNVYSLMEKREPEDLYELYTNTLS